MFYNFMFFAKLSIDFIHLWHDDRALSKLLPSTIPILGLTSRSQTLIFFLC